MNLEIKQLESGDEAILERVALAVFDRAIEPAYLSAYLAQPNQHMMVAIKDGEVVGQIHALQYRHPDKTDDLFIENLGVTPALQRQGVATKVLSAMLERSKALNCHVQHHAAQLNLILRQQTSTAPGWVAKAKLAS